MKRIKDFMSKPFTWGGYLKLTGIGTVIGTLITVVYFVAIFTDWFERGIAFISHPIKWLRSRAENYVVFEEEES